MTALSKTLADALYDHILRNITFTSPTTVYLALHDSGGGVPAHPGKTAAAAFANEVGYTSYQRQAITFGAPGGTEIADGQNNDSLTFPEVDGGTTPFDVTGLSVWTDTKGADATEAESGILLLAGAIDAVKNMEPGDAPLVAAGAINAAFGEALP